VRDQVAGRQALAGLGVIEPEPRDLIADGFVPFDLPLVDESTQSKRREGLGRRADGQEGIGSHGELFFEVLESESLGENDLVIFDDGDGRAGDVDLGQALGYHVVESFQSLFGLCRGAGAPGELEREFLAALGEIAGDLVSVGAQSAGKRWVAGIPGMAKETLTPSSLTSDRAISLMF
jgi:hypothetical protein